MAIRREKKLLLLGKDPGLLKQAETLFAGICGRMFLSWKATALPVDSGNSLQDYDWIVALGEDHREQLQSQHPGEADRIEYWPSQADGMEAEVVDLAARLISGGRKRQPRIVSPEPADNKPIEAKPSGPKPGTVVRVGRETKGRRGKGVTVVYDVPEDEAGLLALAARLKQRCGTGGTVKDGTIEIQGDQRDRLVAELEALGYKVKRTGG